MPWLVASDAAAAIHDAHWYKIRPQEFSHVAVRGLPSRQKVIFECQRPTAESLHMFDWAESISFSGAHQQWPTFNFVLLCVTEGVHLATHAGKVVALVPYYRADTPYLLLILEKHHSQRVLNSQSVFLSQCTNIFSWSPSPSHMSWPSRISTCVFIGTISLVIRGPSLSSLLEICSLIHVIMTPLSWLATLSRYCRVLDTGSWISFTSDLDGERGLLDGCYWFFVVWVV